MTQDAADRTVTITDAPGVGVKLRVVLVLDHLLGSLGLFSLFPVLGLLLAARAPGAGTAVVGIGLFCYSASSGLSALLINRWLPKMRYRTGMAGSVVLSAVSFGLLGFVGDGWALCGLLLLAGLGVSTHFVLSRVLIAESIRDDIGRNQIYSLLQIGVNAAAALGPFVASFLYFLDARVLLACVALCYLLAWASIVLGLPRDLRPPATTNKWPISRAALSKVFRTPSMLRVVLVSTMGAFLYGQFYSAFALLVAHSFDSAALRAGLIAGPAVGIVLLQAAITSVINRRMKAGTKPFTVLGYGTLMFGAGMLLLGLDLPLVLAAVLTVVVFALAEMTFTPMVSTAFAGLPLGSSLEAFNIRQVCWTTGDALGSLAGGGLFLGLYLSGNDRAYWLVLAGFAFVGTTLLMLRPRKDG